MNGSSTTRRWRRGWRGSETCSSASTSTVATRRLSPSGGPRPTSVLTGRIPYASGSGGREPAAYQEPAMRHRLQSQAPGARASGSPGHLSSAQGAGRSSSVGRRLSDVATTAEQSIVASVLGSLCGGCAGGADETGDLPDHGRNRDPGDDSAEVSAVNQVGDAQSPVLRGAQPIHFTSQAPAGIEQPSLRPARSDHRSGHTRRSR